MVVTPTWTEGAYCLLAYRHGLYQFTARCSEVRVRELEWCKWHLVSGGLITECRVSSGFWNKRCSGKRTRNKRLASRAQAVWQTVLWQRASPFLCLACSLRIILTTSWLNSPGFKQLADLYLKGTGITHSTKSNSNSLFFCFFSIFLSQRIHAQFYQR